MGAQKGKDLLLKMDVDNLGSFETVAGLRSRSICRTTMEIVHGPFVSWLLRLGNPGLCMASGLLLGTLVSAFAILSESVCMI